MKLIATLLAGALLCGAGVSAPAQETEQPHIDVVFCIDCSGSMGPVIETAKQKVWAIVNEIARAKPAPVLRIGLLGYGNADRQYRKFELSDDLDEVYKNLITFKDEGWGNEFVGLAIHKAANEMKWAESKQLLKVIYVVGNETARQGPEEFDYSKTAPAAIQAGILVNAIYCGESGGQETWREFARLADGQYLHIAAAGGAVTVQTPFDNQLDELSKNLNLTYVPYGPAGERGRENQAAQDANSRRLGGAANAADRALAKSSYQYNNRNWDLVDASREKGFDWAKVKDEDLPPEVRKLNLAQRKAYVEKKAAERAAIQEKIKTVAAQRDTHIRDEMKKQGLQADQALDEAVRRSVVEQAKRKGFQF
jgi:von Willebrand factor type A domain-containing protein